VDGREHRLSENTDRVVEALAGSRGDDCFKDDVTMLLVRRNSG